MKHTLSGEQRRRIARLACAGFGVGVAAIGGAWALSRPRAEVAVYGAVLGAQTPEVAVVLPPFGPNVVTLDEVHIDGVRGGAIEDDVDVLGEPDVAIPSASMLPLPTPTIAELAPEQLDATHGRGPTPWSSARPNSVSGGLAAQDRHAPREARHDVDAHEVAIAALADARNERVVKQASFRPCWEQSPGASGRVALRIVVDPVRGVSAFAIPNLQVPESVVRCVLNRARSLALRVPPGGGPRSFDISSSFAPQLL
jgi:hypothetical protein